MNNFNRNGRSGGGRSGGGDFRRRDSRGGKDFRRHDSGRREMFKAVCDECGKSCEVPFRPSGDKPIYCSDCFEKKGGGNYSGSNRPRSDFRGPSRDSSDNINKQLLEQANSLNAKLDRILKLLEPSTENIQDSKETEVIKVVKKTPSKDKIIEKKKPSKKEAEKSITKEETPV